MGGLGSGRPRSAASKMTVEESLSIPIGALRKHRLLVDGGHGRLNWWDETGEEEIASVEVTAQVAEVDPWVDLSYRVETEGAVKRVNQRVLLKETLLCYGGRRPWFLCPGCGRRVGAILMPPGQVCFACRRCHGLTYQSCQRRSGGSAY